jgi:hypothetical protein
MNKKEDILQKVFDKIKEFIGLLTADLLFATSCKMTFKLPLNSSYDFGGAQ